MSDKKIEEHDLSKALSALSDLAKGHSSRGTNTTAVESMSGVGGSSQLFHTASNSDPSGGWAGSQSRQVGENGAKDAIDENGTDYKGGAEMVKSIMQKLSKGHTLTAAEYDLLKGMLPFMDKDKDKDKDKKDMDKGMDNDEDDKKDDVAKSLADAAASNEVLNQGMEISDFLAEFVDTISKSLMSMEARNVARHNNLVAALAAEADRQEDFGKSLASALATLGEGLVATTQRVDQVESTPARGAKSQQTLSKGFEGPEGATLSKSQVSATLIDMVESHKIDAKEVLRFESNGFISDETYAKVVAHRSGR